MPLGSTVALAGIAAVLSVILRFNLVTPDFRSVRAIQVSAARIGTCENDRCECHRRAAATVDASTTTIVVRTPETAFAPILIQRDPEGRLDVSLVRRHLDWVKTTHPESTSADVQCEDDVAVEDLVRLLDTCVGAGLATVTASTPRVTP